MCSCLYCLTRVRTPVVPSLHSREYTRAQATIEQQSISQVAATKRAKAEQQQQKSVIAALSDEMSALYKVGTRALKRPELNCRGDDPKTIAYFGGVGMATRVPTYAYGESMRVCVRGDENRTAAGVAPAL